MRKSTFTEKEVIDLTLENVRSYYSRDISATLKPMAENFMWIGSNDFQWCEGLASFQSVTEKEFQEPPAFVSDEEFHLLFHDRSIWVVYGKYKITASMDNGMILHAHVRTTHIWKMADGGLKLVHVHSSHSQDIPLSQIIPAAGEFTADTSFFDYIRDMNTVTADVHKLVFRDCEKKYRYLFPSDILYVKAASQWSIVYTKTESFKVWGLLATYEKKLPDIFRRIHKSYLVNSMYIHHICRYQAVLKDETVLPVGRERYMDLKRYLQQPR